MLHARQDFLGFFKKLFSQIEAPNLYRPRLEHRQGKYEKATISVCEACGQPYILLLEGNVSNMRRWWIWKCIWILVLKKLLRCMFTLYVYVVCLRCMFTLYVYVVCLRCMFTLYVFSRSGHNVVMNFHQHIHGKRVTGCGTVAQWSSFQIE